MAEDKDPFAGLEFDDNGAFDGLTFEDTPQKKNPNVTTSGNQEVSTQGSLQVVEPLSESGAKAEYTWSSGLKTPLATGTEGTPLAADVFRTETTKKLKNTAVKKQDEVAKNYSELKAQDKVIGFGLEYPELQQVKDIEAQLTAMGKVSKPEDVKVFNALVEQRNQLLEKEVTQKSFWEKQGAEPVKTEADFDTPSEYYAYQKQQTDKFAGLVKKQEEHDEIAKQFISPKLKDVVGVVQGAATKQQELLSKIKDDQQIADAAIKEAQALNKDKLVPLGFFDGFVEGMEQTTLSNTLADLYGQGKDEDLQKALENIYTDALVFPKDATTAGEVGQVIGGQVKPLAVGIGSAIASEAVTGNPFIGIGAGSAYYGRMGVGSGLMDGYMTARSQGATQTEAFEIAKQQAKVAGAGGVVEGAVGAIPFLGKGLTQIANQTFKKAVVAGLKDNAVDAVVAGASQVVQNKNLQRLGLDVETSRGVAENMEAEFILGAGMNLAFYAGAKLKPENYTAILVGLSEMPFRDIQLKVDEAVKAGVLDEAKAQKTMADLLETKSAVDAMPQDLTPQEKVATVPIVKEIQSLKKEVDKSQGIVPTASTEARIEELQREYSEKIGAGLTEKEQKEYEKLIDKKQSTDGEGKKATLLPSEKAKIEHYEKRIEKAGKNEANRIAEDLGYTHAKHMLNDLKAKGLGEFENVQDVPKATIADIADTRKDEAIKINQERLGFPTEPEVILSDEAESILEKSKIKKVVETDQLKTLTDELYGAYKSLTQTRDNPNRRFTREQIDKKAADLEKIIETLETVKNLQEQSGGLVTIDFNKEYAKSEKDVRRKLRLERLETDRQKESETIDAEVVEQTEVTPTEITETVTETKPVEQVSEVVEEVKPIENFTQKQVIDEGYKNLKSDIGEKKAIKYFEQADRLIDPNENEVVEYRRNGAVVRDGDKYTLHAFGDMDLKNWRVSMKIDVTDQFQKPTTEPVQEAEGNLLKTTELDNVPIEDVNTQDDAWQENLIDKSLNQVGVKFKKKTANTGTVYYTFETKDGDEYVLRLGDHDKGRYLGREVDGNIVYNKSTTPFEISESLKENLPDLQIKLKKANKKQVEAPSPATENIFDKIDEAKRSKKTQKGKLEAAMDAVKAFGEQGARAIEIDTNFQTMVERLKSMKDENGEPILKVKC